VDDKSCIDMPKAQSHSSSGLVAFLEKPFYYSLFRQLIVSSDHYERYLACVKPFPGCKILDIGCGVGDVLKVLPRDIGIYVGYDMNADYINAAKRRWNNRGTFVCERVSEANLPYSDYFDIVLATALLHHLDDTEASTLFELAHRVLKPGGTLITYDPVVKIEKQQFFEKWIISMDRGKAVRSLAEYNALAKKRFPKVVDTVLRGMLRFPYTIVVMQCTKVFDQRQ